MVSLDNEMYMSIVDVIQIRKKTKNKTESAFPVHLHVLLIKIKSTERCIDCYAPADQ